MTTINYNFVNDRGVKALTVIVDGKVTVLDGDHPNFALALAALRSGDKQAILDSLDLDLAVKNALANEPDFTLDGDTLTYKGEVQPVGLARVFLDVLRTEGDAKPLTNFIKRLANNPSMNSRKQLHAWIDKHGLNIDQDGYFIGYKGVRTSEDGGYVSIASGEGTVDGVHYKHAQLPNYVGANVTVPRSKVDDDANSACSFGLHVGTWDYASTFGHGATLTVRVDPANVVSVPHDCNTQKIRTCEYDVISTAENKWVSSTVWDGSREYEPVADLYEDEVEDWDDDYCECCGRD
jgi:hypothetical protein